ncbi:MAG TPA: ATPase P, partial [Clostridiales bacterium]|nr:ATPase P [Clostridiales bacterium]
SEEVVLDDIILYSPGSQIVTDSFILEGECEVDESFLTGESEPAFKENGDMLYSGSYISSGSCVAQADAVGKDNTSYEITTGAKNQKSRSSEIVKDLKSIIKIISIILIPLGTLFFLRQYFNPQNTLAQATEQTVSALIGMIPSGLILLTSTVFAVIVVKLAKRKVLINELYSVEMIARADTICLDKTGTITEGSMKVEDIVHINPDEKIISESILTSFFASLDPNETMAAIGR